MIWFLWSSSFSGYDAKRAVDEDFEQKQGGESCIMTNSEVFPWWGVDLEKSYQVNKVIISHSNQDCKYTSLKKHYSMDILVIYQSTFCLGLFGCL